MPVLPKFEAGADQVVVAELGARRYWLITPPRTRWRGMGYRAGQRRKIMGCLSAGCIEVRTRTARYRRELMAGMIMVV